MKIAFTVCNRTQLSHALCLGESLLKNNPAFKFVLGWVDSTPLPKLPQWVEVQRILDFQPNEWELMLANYYDFELVAACIPLFAKSILEKYTGCLGLVYFSPTVFIMKSIEPVLNSGVFLQLTPHRLAPENGNITPDEKGILNIGMYHSGSWILHPDGQEKKFLDWWCERTATRANFDLCQGMCMEQLWLNFAPLYYENVQTTRVLGWHIGLHNCDQIPLERVENEYYTQNAPLLSIDFAGIIQYHPVWSDYAYLIKNKECWIRLRQYYKEQVSKYQFVFDRKSVNYGKESDIKSNRIQRKKIIRLIHKLIYRIENYNLTYN